MDNLGAAQLALSHTLTQSYTPIWARTAPCSLTHHVKTSHTMPKKAYRSGATVFT